MNNDLISRSELKEAIKDSGYSHYFEIFDIIDNAPTVAVNCKNCDGYEAGYSAGLKDAKNEVIELFNKYDILLLHRDGKIVPVKNSTRQECYDLLYEIQEMIEWRKLLFNKHLNEVIDNGKEETT